MKMKSDNVKYMYNYLINTLRNPISMFYLTYFYLFISMFYLTILFLVSIFVDIGSLS